MKPIILASQSPRRKELLGQLIGPQAFQCIPSHSEEQFSSGDLDLALLNVAKAKGLEVYGKHPEALVLSADTIVVDKGDILGKPKSKQEAFATLKRLSNREHLVKTGLVLLGGNKPREEVVTTKVHFRPLSDEEIQAYVEEGSCLDKAGSYGIQDTNFVDALEGSYSNVVGLPLYQVATWLDQEKIPLLCHPSLEM